MDAESGSHSVGTELVPLVESAAGWCTANTMSSNSSDWCIPESSSHLGWVRWDSTVVGREQIDSRPIDKIHVIIHNTSIPSMGLFRYSVPRPSTPLPSCTYIQYQYPILSLSVNTQAKAQQGSLWMATVVANVEPTASADVCLEVHLRYNNKVRYPACPSFSNTDLAMLRHPTRPRCEVCISTGHT